MPCGLVAWTPLAPNPTASSTSPLTCFPPHLSHLNSSFPFHPSARLPFFHIATQHTDRYIPPAGGVQIRHDSQSLLQPTLPLSENELHIPSATTEPPTSPTSRIKPVSQTETSRFHAFRYYSSRRRARSAANRHRSQRCGSQRRRGKQSAN